MIRAVLDTNILLSGYVRIRHDTATVQLLDAWRNRLFTLVSSQEQLLELEHAFTKPYFRDRLSLQQIERELSLLRDESSLTTLEKKVSGVATHPADDVILSTAVNGRAAYLVTGDLRFRNRVPEYQGVRLLSPAAFLRLMRAEENGP